MLEISSQLLKKISIFGALNDDSLAFLLEQSDRVDVARNDFFFREGEDADAFFVLEQGRVAVIKDWQGNHFLLSELSEGDCFGEMALIEMHARNASVLALEACRAIRLGFDSVSKLRKRDLQQFTLLQMNLARELSRRLRDANERLFESRVDPEARMQAPGYPEFSLKWTTSS
jgi:CRP/FNR family cyclic AMP-dependent transcriptional regulator